MKRFLILLFLLVSFNVNAGFLLGYAVGSSGSSSESNPKSEIPTVITSDGNSTILICARFNDTDNCELPNVMRLASDRIQHPKYTDSYSWREYISPLTYVERSGYKKLLKQGVVIHRRQIYIIMEVQK